MMTALALTLALATPPAAPFDTHFTGRTLRFDFYHSGTASEERVSPDVVRLEGDWPGSRTHLLDDTNLGKYLFEIVDRATNLPLYSRGFASIYGEWETTGEARSGPWRTFHESLRFPEPRGPAQVVLKKRGGDGAFREIFSTVIDPASRFVDRSPIIARGKLTTVFENGPARQKVDLLFLGDGYTAAEEGKFQADLARLTGYLFAAEPFASQKQHFNVRGLQVPAVESGVSNPRGGQWRQSPLGLSYNAFDSDRYMLTGENKTLREIAAQAPYDVLVLVANSRKYGGGGIFNLWTTVAADSAETAYILVHELGHSFAGLADEYYTSQVAYEDFNAPGTEPWEPNVTALSDPENLKWKDLLAPGTPVPTPWQQAAYDEVSLAYQEKRQAMREAGASEEEMEALFAEVKATTRPMLEGEEHYGEIGAFEGAAYEAKGLYRPAVDCIMFTRNPGSFCQVCARGIERVIRLYTEQERPAPLTALVARR